MAASSSSSSNTLPVRVTRTARGFSRLQEQEGGVVLSWCDLPSDLYGRILRRLDSRRDRVRLSAVCRHWRVCGARQHVPGGLPMRVTRTPRGTHVVHVRGFSNLQEQQCGVGGFVDSPAFAVAGLHWAIRYYPGSDGDGHVGASVGLLTEGAVAWAYVGLLLLDQTTGLADTVIWDRRTTRFDAARADSHTGGWRGRRKIATRSELKGSGFVRGDCLKIECVLDVCRRPGPPHRLR